MSQTQQTTRASKTYSILLLLAFLQITLSNSHPLSTTQGSPTCDPSDPTAECGPSTSPSNSPAPRSCQAHQKEWDALASDEERYMKVCDLVTVAEKVAAETLEQSDLVNCYRPRCDAENKNLYRTKQCSSHFHEWCWCSTPHGQAFPDTFQKNIPEGICETRPHCIVDGNHYDIGSIFTPPSVCGLCECHSDGTHSCFLDFTPDPDANGQLSTEQLETLKSDLLLVFHLQHNQQPVNIQLIHKTDPEFTDDETSAFLSSKFIIYDTDEDGALNNFEKFKFHAELGELFGCNKFFNHLNELLDGNMDSEISLQEWNAFFGATTASEVDLSGDSPTQQNVVEKREALLDIRKPLHLRKKFQYLIS